MGKWQSGANLRGNSILRKLLLGKINGKKRKKIDKQTSTYSIWCLLLLFCHSSSLAHSLSRSPFGWTSKTFWLYDVMTYVCIIHAKPIQALRVTVRNAAGNFKLATIFYSQSSRPDGKSNGTPEMFSFVRSNIHHWFFYVFNTVKIRMNTFLWGVWRLSVCFHVGWKLISLKKFSHSKAKNSINNIHWMEPGRGKSLQRMGKKCQKLLHVRDKWRKLVGLFWNNLQENWRAPRWHQYKTGKKNFIRVAIAF